MGVLDALFALAIARMEKTSETGLREGGVRGSGKNLISRQVSEWGREAIRRQKLLDGEVRKLDDLRNMVVDDGDQT